jgi:hypothetical protein
LVVEPVPKEPIDHRQRRVPPAGCGSEEAVESVGVGRTHTAVVIDPIFGRRLLVDHGLNLWLVGKWQEDGADQPWEPLRAQTMPLKPLRLNLDPPMK